jgi:hypothetical protein
MVDDERAASGLVFDVLPTVRDVGALTPVSC